MPDAFNETLELSADSFFLLPGSEILTYFPVTGTSRKIKAIVDRTGAEPMDDLSGGQREVVEILVKNSSKDGIASSEVDTGGDKLQVGIRKGTRPVMARIVEILSQDAGMLKLKVY